MSLVCFIRSAGLLCMAGSMGLAFAQAPRSADEPLADEYSFDRGVAFLRAIDQEWAERRKCVTCHTNGLALVAQPELTEELALVRPGREFAAGYLTSYLEGEAKASGQHGSLTGLVATTAFLALSDARTGLGVQPATRLGLDYAWSKLSDDGTWEDWLQCNWPPFEVDAEFAPTLMLVALGELRERVEAEQGSGLSRQDERAASRMARWLRKNPPSSMHSKAMRVWAARYWRRVARSAEVTRWRRELVQRQGEDGGWSMAALAGPEWRRDGGDDQATQSEAYPTAFSVYVLMETGADVEGEMVRRALTWLEGNQRASGAWFTRSPRRDGRHYISHAATAFALMALAGQRNGR